MADQTQGVVVNVDESDAEKVKEMVRAKSKIKVGDMIQCLVSKPNDQTTPCAYYGGVKVTAISNKSIYVEYSRADSRGRREMVEECIPRANIMNGTILE